MDHAFVSLGSLRRPNSVLGWIITLAALAFIVQAFWAIDRRSHSVSDTLYGIYPFWA